MKPRLEPCDATDADAIAWAELVFRLSRKGRMLGSVLWTRSLMQDRTDASLMFRAQWPANRDATDLWLASTLWAEVRGKPQ
jgi:hypothetical protein